MERLRTEPVTPHELDRVRNQFARDYIVGRESNQEKATQLAHAVVIHKGDASSADGEFEIFQRTTAADVQRVAKTYFTPKNRTIITILPEQGAAR
jgi:predicted Zn-dependent peptidase